MTRRMVLAAVLVPVLGIVVMVGRAEFARRSGVTWQVPISGHDPRDLLQGHYLRYQYEFLWVGPDTCSVDPDPARTTPVTGCCLCLTSESGTAVPEVRQVDCDEPEDACECLITAAEVTPPRRYYVPENRARALEHAVAQGGAAVELTCAPDGGVAVGELLLAGEPWLEALD